MGCGLTFYFIFFDILVSCFMHQTFLSLDQTESCTVFKPIIISLSIIAVHVIQYVKKRRTVFHIKDHDNGFTNLYFNEVFKKISMLIIQFRWDTVGMSIYHKKNGMFSHRFFLTKGKEVDWVWLAYVRNNTKAGLLLVLKSCIFLDHLDGSG